MHIVKVKHLPATTFKGSRLKCSFIGWKEKPSKTYPYPYSSGFETIAKEYLESILGDECDKLGCSFDMIGHSYDWPTQTTYVVFAFNPSPRHVMVTDKASVTV